MITLDDVNMTLDMRDILVFGSALSHEKACIGLEAFCHRYKAIIEDFRRDMPFEWFCYLLAYLQYFDSSFQYDKTVHLEGYMVPSDVHFYIRTGMHDMYDLDTLWNSAIPCFRDRGILISEVDEVI